MHYHSFELVDFKVQFNIKYFLFLILLIAYISMYPLVCLVSFCIFCIRGVFCVSLSGSVLLCSLPYVNFFKAFILPGKMFENNLSFTNMTWPCQLLFNHPFSSASPFQFIHASTFCCVLMVLTSFC